MDAPENESLSLGMQFSSVEDAKKAVSKYNGTNFTNLTVTTNNSKSLVFECKHGRVRNCKNTGKRPNQHYNFLGCGAVVRLYKSKDGRMKITKVNLEHNHPVS